MDEENEQGVFAYKSDGTLPFALEFGQERFARAIEERSCRRAPEEIGKIAYDGEHVAGRDISLGVKQAGVAPKITRREEEREVDGSGFGRSVAEVEYQRDATKPYAAYGDGAFVAAAQKID